MIRSRANGLKKKKGILDLKILVEKLQRRLSLGRRPTSDLDQEFEEFGDSTSVPEDVKEGHFPVMAMDDGETKRFVVALSYLTHPTFLRLLEQAAEKFGFDQEGTLTIPCQLKELERILAEQWKGETDVNSSIGCDSHKIMLESKGFNGYPVTQCFRNQLVGFGSTIMDPIVFQFDPRFYILGTHLDYVLLRTCEEEPVLLWVPPKET